jgi:hypothetical protein
MLNQLVSTFYGTQLLIMSTVAYRYYVHSSLLLCPQYLIIIMSTAAYHFYVHSILSLLCPQ